MNKNTFYISCPIDTYSGYWARSRDIAKALIELGKYDVKIIPQRWGNTPMGFINDNSEWEFLNKHLYLEPKLTQQPDIWCMITVPNEFQPVGKYNIGITAGIETTLAPASWIEGCNRMDLIIVPSNHARDVFLNTTFDKMDNNTKQKVGTLKCEKPIEVLFEGVDTEIFHKLDKIKGTDLESNLSEIPEEFCFLYTGHWIHGDIGHDRKDVGKLVYNFLETFKCRKHIIVGMMKDKSHKEFIDCFKNIVKSIQLVDIPNQKGAISKEEFKNKLEKSNINISLANSIEESLKSIAKYQNSIGICTGSLYLTGEVLNLN